MLQVIRNLGCKDTVALCKWMLEQAEAGNLRGVGVCLRMAAAQDEVLFTGSCARHPEDVMRAMERLIREADRRLDAQAAQKIFLKGDVR